MAHISIGVIWTNRGTHRKESHRLPFAMVAELRRVTSAADHLLRSRPRSLAELLLIFRTLEWILFTDAVIVDRGADRRLNTGNLL